jgi:hypothetical protein
MAEDMSDGRSQSWLSVSELLSQLQSVNAGNAWKQFLDRYAHMIISHTNLTESRVFAVG